MAPPDQPTSPRRRTARALVCLALVLGCFPRVPTDGDPSLVLDPPLKAAAEAMDPGPQRPLYVEMPAWLTDDKQPRLAGRDGVVASSLDALAEANAALAAWGRAPRVNPKEMLLEVVVLAHGLVRAEQAVALGIDDPELLAALTTAYAELARTAHLRGALSRYLERRVATSKLVDAAARKQLRQADMFFETAARRSPALALHVGARVLREWPRHAAVPHVLRQLSALRLYQGRDADAVTLYRFALERAQHPTAADAAALAWLCFQALDPACGDEALAEVRRYAESDASGPGSELLAALAGAAEDARRLVALGSGAHGLEPGLERAERLHALHRDRDAEALLHTLRAEHPGDPRPAVGLAALALRHGDFLAAADLYQETAGQAPRDSRASAVFLAALLASRIDLLPEGPAAVIAGDEPAAILSLIAAHAARAPGQAAVLELGVRTALEVLPLLGEGVPKDRSVSGAATSEDVSKDRSDAATAKAGGAGEDVPKGRSAEASGAAAKAGGVGEDVPKGRSAGASGAAAKAGGAGEDVSKARPAADAGGSKSGGARKAGSKARSQRAGAPGEPAAGGGDPASKARSILAGLPADAHALVERFPDEQAAWQLVFATIGFAPQVDEALAIVTAPRSPALADDPELALLHARALVGLALQWEQDALLPIVDAALAGLPAAVDPGEAALLRATVDAVHGRLGDVGRHTRATTAFRDMSEESGGTARALALNNLGVLLAEAGEVQAAVDALTEALRADPEAPAPRLNLVALAFTADGQQHRELEAVLPAIAGGSNAALRLHARAWLVALAARGHGEATSARAEFTVELARARATTLHGAVAPGRWGVAVVERLTVAASLTNDDDLAVEMAMTAQPWQVLPSPQLGALLQPAGAPEEPSRGRGAK